MYAFRVIIHVVVFPDNWAEGIIIPLFKKNDVNDVNNYRGITLISCFSKNFTGVLNNRIYKWAEENNIVSDAQFGFRQNMSTVDAIFILNAAINKILNNKGRLYCAFIDLRKAFDCVIRNALWYKIHRFGINAKLFSIIKNMYSNIKSCVRNCHRYSDFFDCAIGLRQGEVMSPILFSLFLEDLELFLQDDVNSGLNINDIMLLILLFADDMAVFGKTPEDLQRSLDLLKVYCGNWGLNVNTDKTKIMVFRKRGNLKPTEKWYYNDVLLDVVNNFNYLGTCFSYTGKFMYNQEILAGKGLKALNILLFKLRQLRIKPSTACQLFDAFVGSILSYGSEIWGITKSKEIERIHLKFLKSILCVKSSTSNMAVYGELGRFPLYISRYVRVIKYWIKLMKSDNVLIKELYLDMMVDANRGLKNWASQVKMLLDMYGFSHIWLTQHVTNLENFHIVFKQRVIDEFIQNWHVHIDNSKSLILYKN